MAITSSPERIRDLEHELMPLGRQLVRITEALATYLSARCTGPDNAAAFLIAVGDNPHRLRSGTAFWHSVVCLWLLPFQEFANGTD